MVQGTGKYTVITGASSCIGYEAAKAFAERGKNLVITARRKNNLEMLKREILEKYPDLDSVIRSADLSVPENAHQFYEGLRGYEIETWINNAGFGSYDSVADQDLGKIRMMLNLNIETLTILSSLYDSEKVVANESRKRWNMINIVICDDEPNIRACLSHYKRMQMSNFIQAARSVP